MKRVAALLLFTALAGCSHYSSSDDTTEVGSNGYSVRCDASPANQPGCYEPPPSFNWWPTDKLKFQIGRK